MQLTDTAVKKFNYTDKPYKKYDSLGLFIYVCPKRRKIWKFRYKFNQKHKELTLGSYPNITLKEARKKRDELRALLDKKIDPSTALERGNGLYHLDGSPQCSFEVIAKQWFEKKVSGFTTNHQNRTLRYINEELNPYLGQRPIADIKAPDILKILRRLEEKGLTDTVYRVKGVTSKIFRFAMASGLTETDPTYGLDEALITHKVQHFSALTEPKEVAELLFNIENYAGHHSVKNLLKLSPLLLARPGEILSLTWSDLDLESAQICIPKERMKMRQPHIIPLSRQAVDIINDMKQYEWRSDYVFPSTRGPGRPLSENTANCAIRNMGYDKSQMTAHGFRAMARTILDEVLEYPIEWIEQQLAHTVRDPNGRAYNRTKHLDQRHFMLQDWADYLEWLLTQYQTTKNYKGYESKMQNVMGLFKKDFFSLITQMNEANISTASSSS